MTQQQINSVTLAALAEWASSNSKATFGAWCFAMKQRGFFWGADETLDEVPSAV
jgi:hypothetical protein